MLSALEANAVARKVSRPDGQPGHGFFLQDSKVLPSRPPCYVGRPRPPAGGPRRPSPVSLAQAGPLHPFSSQQPEDSFQLATGSLHSTRSARHLLWPSGPEDALQPWTCTPALTPPLDSGMPAPVFSCLPECACWGCACAAPPFQSASQMQAFPCLCSSFHT